MILFRIIYIYMYTSMDTTKQHNVENMADAIQDEIETTADENGVFSDSSSDVEIRYDKQQRKLTAKLDDELFDVKFKKIRHAK